jgi:hypothetical protein
MMSAVLHRRPQSNPRGTSTPRAKEPRQKSANRRAFLLDCYRRPQDTILDKIHERAEEQCS